MISQAQTRTDEPAETSSSTEAADRDRRRHGPRFRVMGPRGATPLRMTSENASHESLTAYLRDLRRHPLLTVDEEAAIAREFFETRDSRLASRLVAANLRLVVKIAREYHPRQRDLMDLIQEGNLGLIKALQRFDPARNVRLSTYAGWWIRAHMLQFILANRRVFKVATTVAQRRIFFNMSRQREELRRLGKEGDAKEVAAALRVSEEEVREMERRLVKELSWEAPINNGSDSGARALRDVVADDESGRPDVMVETAQADQFLRGRLDEFAGTLRPRELEILRDRVLCDEPVTLADLATRFSVTRQRICQLETRIKNRLRQYLESIQADRALAS